MRPRPQAGRPAPAPAALRTPCSPRQALLLLRPHEDAYVNFLQLRKVPLQAMAPQPGLPPLRPAMTPLLVADRDVMERAARACVSEEQNPSTPSPSEHLP